MELVVGFIVAHCLLSLILFVVLWQRVRNNYPRRKDLAIRYEESFASGYSHHSKMTKIGGATNSLWVTVTEDCLLIFPEFPFSLVAFRSDLEHIIPFGRINEIVEHDGKIDVSFDREDNTPAKLTLKLRKPHRLIGHLEGCASSVPHNNALDRSR